MMNTSEELISEIKKGRPVVVVDDENRENEGDIIMAAEHITPEWVNFMCKHARGLICLALHPEQVDRLKLPQMVPESLNQTSHGTAFTVSIEASEGISTGISAADRAHTILVASHPEARPKDVITPGHIFPIRARAGGVIERQGHTEAGVELAKLAGLTPSAVICEVMNDDGTMARVSDLRVFSKIHNLKMGTIEDLVKYVESLDNQPVQSNKKSEQKSDKNNDRSLSEMR